MADHKLSSGFMLLTFHFADTCRVPSQTRCWRSLIIVVFDSPFAEKYMSIVLAMEAGEGSGHSRRSRHFTSLSLFPTTVGQKR